MTAGRLRDDYPTFEFAAQVGAARRDQKLSLRELELRSRVNHGTISHVLKGDRPCSRQDRQRLMETLGFTAAAQELFIPRASADSFLRFGLRGEDECEHGSRLMSRACYREAFQLFSDVVNVASKSRDLEYQAVAAERLAWFYSELEQYSQAQYWIARSINFVERILKTSVRELPLALNASQVQDGPTLKLAHLLSRSLFYDGKMRTVSLLHGVEQGHPVEKRQQAIEAFARSVALDERLPNGTHLGHDLRWNAVLLSIGADVRLKDVHRLISASRDRFSRGSLAHVLLLREEGVVRWQVDRPAKAQAFLSDAAEALAAFGDGRALGATYCVLSKVILSGSDDPRRARRYALAAAILHPFGYVLDHCRSQLTRAPGELNGDLDALWNEQRPFNLVHTVFSQIAATSAATKDELMQRHLAAVRARPNATFLPFPT